MSEPTTAAGDALLTDLIQDHEAPSYHVIERVRRGILAIEAEALAEVARLRAHEQVGNARRYIRQAIDLTEPSPEYDEWLRDGPVRVRGLLYALDALASIPAEPEQGDPWNGHEWMQREQDYYAFCRVCGTVRRADDKNKPCKGPVRIELRAEPEQADEVAGLHERSYQIGLRAHRRRIAELQQAISDEYDAWAVVEDAQRARLAPARDDTSGGAS